MDTKQPARAWAAQIVDAWIERRPFTEIIERTPGHLRPLVRIMANNSRDAIIAHAARPLPVVPRGLTGLYAAVNRYKNARRYK